MGLPRASLSARPDATSTELPPNIHHEFELLSMRQKSEPVLVTIDGSLDTNTASGHVQATSEHHVERISRY